MYDSHKLGKYFLARKSETTVSHFCENDSLHITTLMLSLLIQT